MTVKLIWQRFKIYTLHMFFFLLAILYCLYFEMLFFNFRLQKSCQMFGLIYMTMPTIRQGFFALIIMGWLLCKGY